MIDLRPHFKYLEWRPMPHSMGIPVASDWVDKSVDDPIFGIYKRCGLWTMDEAQILHECAKRMRGDWLDIGSHTGWTTAHIAAAGCWVTGVDPMYCVNRFAVRAMENVSAFGDSVVLFDGTSEQYFKNSGQMFDGVVIDGNHDPGEPERDALGALSRLKDRAVVLFHDFIGMPVRKAVEILMLNGFKCRVYDTAHYVAICWRGEFIPPEHEPLPGVDWKRLRTDMADFNFAATV